MLKHAQHVLGTEILLMLEQNRQFVESMRVLEMPSVHERKGTSSAATSHFSSMLFPTEAEFYTVFTDINGGVFVRAAGNNSVFFLQEQWLELAKAIKQDSVCRVICYRDRTQRLILGAYDVLRVQGVDYAELPVVKRHALLHSVLAHHGSMQNIVPHWVGEEGCLVQHMKANAFCNNMPFVTEHILRLDESEGTEVYRRVLRPLQIL